jgi:hypothetical protein
MKDRPGSLVGRSRKRRGAGAPIMSKGQDHSFPLMPGAYYFVSFTGRYA